MASRLQRAFRIDEHVGQHLRVAHFGFATPDLRERIVAVCVGLSRREAVDGSEGRSQAGRDVPVFALEIERDVGMTPDKSGRQRDADALSGIGRRNNEDVLVAIVAEKLDLSQAPRMTPSPFSRSEFADVTRRRPARAAVVSD